MTPTVVTGTSVEPYTRVTTACSKYAAALRISDGGHRCAAADEHLEIGQPGVGPLGGGEQAVEKRGGPGHVGAALGEHQRDGGVGVPALHQHRRRCPAAAGIRTRRSIRRCVRSATGTRNVSPPDRPASARRAGGSARGSNYGCAERPSAGRWCRRCRGSSARRRGSAPAAPSARASANSARVRRVSVRRRRAAPRPQAATASPAVTRSSIAA